MSNYGIKNDVWIAEQVKKSGMIEQFEPELVRQLGNYKVISYGLSSYGYDIRLSDRDFKIFHRIPGSIVDPRSFNSDYLETIQHYTDYTGRYFIIPAHSYGLGVAVERLRMPQNVTAICIGKSTYARAGIICNMTPVEAGWEGHLTLEFSNSSDCDCKVYANQGVAQLLFFEGGPCKTSYSDRKGKYQGQGEVVVPPLV
ncbi:MAG: dCTP deaminase [Waterburya sp.]